jgi:hypothetical protein
MGHDLHPDPELGQARRLRHRSQVVHTEQQRILLEETELSRARSEAVIAFTLREAAALPRKRGAPLAGERGSVPHDGRSHGREIPHVGVRSVLQEPGMTQGARPPRDADF